MYYKAKTSKTNDNETKRKNVYHENCNEDPERKTNYE